MAIVFTWAGVGLGIAIVMGLTLFGALLGLKHALESFDRRHGLQPIRGNDAKVRLEPFIFGPEIGTPVKMNDRALKASQLPVRCPHCGQLNLPRCPRCGSEKVYSMFRPWQFHCRRCGFDALDNADEAKAIMEGLKLTEDQLQRMNDRR